MINKGGKFRQWQGLYKLTEWTKGWQPQTFLSRWPEWQGEILGNVELKDSEVGVSMRSSKFRSSKWARRGWEEGGYLLGWTQGATLSWRALENRVSRAGLRQSVKDTPGAFCTGEWCTRVVCAWEPVASVSPQLIVSWHHTLIIHNGHGESIYSTEICSRCCKSGLGSYREPLLNTHQPTTRTSWSRV